ncbi:hypothetical protein ElyMa_006049100 [Elysia marginata]|uniref:Sushi domain-containing protein n=1 Tax=Elysia marginata TaxID=1093978 RepID=A0AAV4GN08_9GAST|nr:hypothetical protein ElyMa_006049100 [Elysia marginata]
MEALWSGLYSFRGRQNVDCPRHCCDRIGGAQTGTRRASGLCKYAFRTGRFKGRFYCRDSASFPVPVWVAWAKQRGKMKDKTHGKIVEKNRKEDAGKGNEEGIEI